MNTRLARGVVAATLELALCTAAISMTALPVTSSLAGEPAAEQKVMIDNFTFNPPKLTVKAGTSVTWTNGDDIPHTVTSSTKLFKSQALDTEDTYTFTFTTPGTYEYFCSLHPHMTGTIVVEAVSGSSGRK